MLLWFVFSARASFFLVASSLASLVSSFPAVGFSGSRVCGGVPALVCSWLCGLLVRSGFSAPVFVGCARGCDLVARSAFPAARVFRVAFSGRAAFASRSRAFCSAVASASGLLVSFPSGSCPSGVRPRAAFVGGGSGSWASLAFARSLGCAVLVCLPAGVSAPVWLRGRVVCAAFGCRFVFVPPVVVPSLF